MHWDRRNLTVAEAAAMSGIHRASIDLLIHRAKDVSILFSEKRGARRWFSPKDVAVLRIAYELERGGMSWLMAIGTAFDHLENPPDSDDFLFAPVRVRRGCGLPFISKSPPEFDRSMIVVPIGRIVADIIKEADLVAVQS